MNSILFNWQIWNYNAKKVYLVVVLVKFWSFYFRIILRVSFLEFLSGKLFKFVYGHVISVIFL